MSNIIDEMTVEEVVEHLRNRLVSLILIGTKETNRSAEKGALVVQAGRPTDLVDMCVMVSRRVKEVLADIGERQDDIQEDQPFIQLIFLLRMMTSRRATTGQDAVKLYGIATKLEQASKTLGPAEQKLAETTVQDALRMVNDLANDCVNDVINEWEL